MNDLEKYFTENTGRLIYKWKHYFEIYDRHFSRFRGTDVHVVEFGVYQGGSLQMWKQYFGPHSKIFGIDINHHCKKLEEAQIEIFIGDQEDRTFLKSLTEKIPRIDILIDDGGHTMTQQISTYEELFPYIEKNGIYLCEDLHTSYWPEWGGGYKKDGTFIEYSKSFIDYLNAWQAVPTNRLNITEFTQSVHSLHYYNSILVIEKRPIEKPSDMKTGKLAIPDYFPPLNVSNMYTDRKKKKLVMTLCVRNEEDIIRYNIDFHLSKGVDFIIATDNASTDSTRDILKEYQERGVLHLIDETTCDHDQAKWNNHMAQIARDEYAADIILHCDADEFWYPRSGNLKDEILKRQEDILAVDVTNILLKDKGGDETFPEDTRFAVSRPIVDDDYAEKSKEMNLFYFKYPSKVVFKTAKKMLLVSQGNHTVTNKDDSITEGKSRDIVIYHYPVRSKAQFFQKSLLGGSSCENSDIHSGDTNFHLKRWYNNYQKGLLDFEYKKLILPDGEIDRLMLEGFIEELDFNKLILGQENQEDGWRYFTRKFEYEDMFRDSHLPWAGHKNFAYDLVRNIKPQTIVELGTFKGTSFFSFCQAVKDAHYDANLYAIDTWRGDDHAGFYDDNVFKEVKEIKEKYYGGMKINLLRETFDKAVDEFENSSIDLLHIDGLHTYTAVKHDFETWFPKVKKEGIILLHDIFINRDDFGVYKFWEELKSEYKTIEFYQSYGLGVLFIDRDRYQRFFDKEREWQIRYSYIAEDKKNREIRERETQIDNLKKNVADRDGQIANIFSSRSWRVTRPLRDAIRLLSGYGDSLANGLRNDVKNWIRHKPRIVQKEKGSKEINNINHDSAAEDKTNYFSKIVEIVEKNSDIVDINAASPVDVIVPIYNAYEDLEKCLYSLLKYQDIYSIILIDDCSTDKRVKELLRMLKEHKGNRFSIEENENNIGYLKSVNKGMKLSKKDVILINSDTIVTSGYARKMRACAYSDDSIATVTPFTNNGIMCSIPEFLKNNDIPEGFTIDSFAECVEMSSLCQYPQLVTAVGFCMYIKRKVIDNIGYFDEENFEKGYGEEGDFSARANQKGYKNVLCDNTFVFHKGQASFLDEQEALLLKNHIVLAEKHPGFFPAVNRFEQLNPLKELHDNIKLNMSTWNIGR